MQGERLFYDVLADIEAKSVEALGAAASTASVEVLDAEIQFGPAEAERPAAARVNADVPAVEARRDLIEANRSLQADMQQIADRRGLEAVAQLFRSLADHYERIARELSLVDPERTCQ